MTKSVEEPFIITLETISDKGGDLNAIEEQVPFEVKRVFWVYNIEKEISRGSHAHQDSEKCLICMHGSVRVVLTNQQGVRYNFTLDHPSKVLYFPKMHWIDLTYNEGSILTVLASTKYDEEKFVSDMEAFRNLS